MLTLDNASLSDALSKCDRQTFIEIQIAQNRIPWEEIEWIPSEEGNWEVHGPRTIRRSVQEALDAVTIKKGQKGRKPKPYPIALARTCLLIWQKYRPPKAPGRLEFIQAAFVATGMHLSDKGLETLLSKVKLRRVRL